MTLHSGRIYEDGDVSLRPPIPEIIHHSPKSSDVLSEVEGWRSTALAADDIYYFSIYRDDELVGQIFLHDIDWQIGESLVGYHLFQPRFRGIGIGTKALALLQRFVAEWGKLSRLIIITSADNTASQRVAQKCGFHYVGPPREDPNGLVFEWIVPKLTDQPSLT